MEMRQVTKLSAEEERMSLALKSLKGLSVGDAFGEKFFYHVFSLIDGGQMPPTPWNWTDDTVMAMSIVDELLIGGEIDMDRLAKRFAERYAKEPWRGYGGGAARLLTKIHEGADWKLESKKLFDGGSWGNGGAMRAAPIGAYFSGDPESAEREADKSARVTHAHVDGRAGAIAIAAASALIIDAGTSPGVEFIDEVVSHMPESETRVGLGTAKEIHRDDFERAVFTLGTGNRVSAMDTVPFCIWMTAHHSDSFERAMVATASGFGDSDTTCAIVGGIVCLVSDIRGVWTDRTESLSEQHEYVNNN